MKTESQLLLKAYYVLGIVLALEEFTTKVGLNGTPPSGSLNQVSLLIYHPLLVY